MRVRAWPAPPRFLCTSRNACLRRYGFHKTSPDPTCREFRHPLFQRGRPELVADIRRKTSGTTKPKESTPATAASVPVRTGGSGGGGSGPTPPPPIHVNPAQQSKDRGMPPLPASLPATASHPIPPAVAVAAATAAAGGLDGRPAHTQERSSADLHSVNTSMPLTFLQSLAGGGLEPHRLGVDAMLTQLVQQRTAQQELQAKVAALQQAASSSEAEVKQLRQQLQHSANRQSAIQRRLERLMMFTYELYRSLWSLHQQGKLTGAGGASPRLTAGDAPALLTDGSAGPTDLDKLFFSPSGIVSPEKFAKMLDFVELSKDRYTRGPSALRSGLGDDILRIADAAATPPEVVSSEARRWAGATGTGLGTEAAPPPASRPAPPVAPPSKATDPLLQALGELPGGSAGSVAGPSPPLVPASAMAPLGSLDGFETGSLPSLPVPASLDGDALPPPAQVGGVKRARSTDGLEQEVESLTGPRVSSSAAMAQELNHLMSRSEALSDMEHCLLGQLAERDMELSHEYPEAHADFSQALGHGMGQGELDKDGLALVDLDEQGSSSSGTRGDV